MGTTTGTGAPLEHALAYLALGSNMGDSRGHIVRAITEINALPATRVLRAAPLYGSGPWGKTDQPDFVNTAIEVLTEKAPRALLIAVKNIEQAHGREESAACRRLSPITARIVCSTGALAPIRTDSAS